MFPSLAKGIPEIGVKKFEPLYIDSVSISKGSGNLVLSGGFKHLIVKGPSNATVENAVYVTRSLKRFFYLYFFVFLAVWISIRIFSTLT